VRFVYKLTLLYANCDSNRFVTEKLVYDSRSNVWHSPQDCIWATESLRIPGKFSAQSQYGSLEPFFTKILEVEIPTLELHITGLKAAVSPSPSLDDVKQQIRNICQFHPNATNLNVLWDCKCLPVNRADKSLAWMSPCEPFAINDRKEYSSLFKDKINILSFTLEEVHEFEAFLIGLVLRHHFLSKLVTPATSADGGQINEQLTGDLRRKAYAICRSVHPFILWIFLKLVTVLPLITAATTFSPKRRRRSESFENYRSIQQMQFIGS
jgi:hypothetical protein